MDLSNLVAVSGYSGLFKMAKNRSNGLILENFDSGKKKFYSSRKHQFTPLESITIYTYDEGAELTKVFQIMKEQAEENPPIAIKSTTEELREYFSKILPDHDEEKVYTSDIKKIIKWYNFLLERGLLEETEEEETQEGEDAEEIENSEENEDSKEESTEESEE